MSVEARGDATRLSGLRQEGSLKVLLPRVAGGHVEAVLLNTAGGLTGGDGMCVEARAGAGARLVLATQAAERAYRSAGGEATVDVGLRAGPGARLDWLPQETILFDGCALRRRLRLDMAPDARALLAEAVVLGRRAMGERVARGRFRDRWELRVGGRLVLADALRIGDGDWARLPAPGALGPATAWASLALLAPEADALLPRLRRALSPPSGASLVAGGVLFARVLAEDGWALRQALLPALELLRGGPLPKVWRL